MVFSESEMGQEAQNHFSVMFLFHVSFCGGMGGKKKKKKRLISSPSRGSLLTSKLETAHHSFKTVVLF